MKISIIAAIDKNGALGKEGKLPWKIKEDLAYFKERTDGHIVIMGRKTYESLPKKLDNRTVVVMTTQEDYKVDDPDVIVKNSIADVILYLHQQDADHVYVAGGGKIYEQFVGYADFLLLTRVETEIEGADAHFPLIQLGNWNRVASAGPVDSESGLEYSFEVYKRA